MLARKKKEWTNNHKHRNVNLFSIPCIQHIHRPNVIWYDVLLATPDNNRTERERQKKKTESTTPKQQKPPLNRTILPSAKRIKIHDLWIKISFCFNIYGNLLRSVDTFTYVAHIKSNMKSATRAHLYTKAKCVVCCVCVASCRHMLQNLSKRNSIFTSK